MKDTDQNLKNPEVQRQAAVFTKNAVDVIESKELEKRISKSLETKVPMRIKFGMDPSSPDLHIGHAIPLLKLRSLQELGHKIVLIVGDATAMVGDPSGRNKLRPQLTREAVESNLITYTEQAGRVLDLEATEVRRNSEWFDAMSFEEVLRLAARMTVAQMVERDTFQTRIQASEPIGIHEFLYPLMQGWDSVQVEADLEIGGNDQLFNLLVGRRLQEQEQQIPQMCLTLPLINGLDGRKMSKSYGNSVGLTDEPNDMFGKVMSMEDSVMQAFFELLTPLASDEIGALLAGHPREAKARLAQEITTVFHDQAAGSGAREAFDRQFKEKQIPDDIPERVFEGEWGPEGVPFFALIRSIGLAATGSDARRVIQQGGARIDGEVIKVPTQAIARPDAKMLVQVGKRKFAWVRAE
ncbi:MAG: tyrosyl-tRNA synthetase [Planctomycetota bacterium]|jgi:tyrosyl-tRNA synthetase